MKRRPVSPVAATVLMVISVLPQAFGSASTADEAPVRKSAGCSTAHLAISTSAPLSRRAQKSTRASATCTTNCRRRGLAATSSQAEALDEMLSRTGAIHL